MSMTKVEARAIQQRLEAAVAKLGEVPLGRKVPSEDDWRDIRDGLTQALLSVKKELDAIGELTDVAITGD